MNLSHVNPEIRDRVRWMPRPPVGNPLARWLLRTISRLAPDQQHQGVTLQKTSTATGVNLRIYTPDNRRSDAALLWIHGGGLVIGNPGQDDKFCANNARKLGIVVISTAYRLAPEFPFPAALDDCYSAWRWMLDSTDITGIDPSHIVIGGQSAGGGLAASLAQKIHDTDTTQPLGQWLFSPMLDDRTTGHKELTNANHFVWNNKQNFVGWRSYLGLEPGADNVPDYAVPARRQNLQGLPQAWIGTGDIDLFYEEDKTYAERLKSAGVPCEFDVVTGAPHGFETIAPGSKLAQDYLTRSRDWLTTIIE